MVAMIAAPPGEVALDACKKTGIDQKALACILCWTEKDWVDFIGGNKSLTNLDAGVLATVFGTSVQFWLKLEADWESTRPQMENREQHQRREKRR